MRPVPAEVRPDIDLVMLRHQWDLACGKEERAEKTLAETRLEKGRILVNARKAFPARGPRSRGWGELLAKWKIAEQTARDYMKLAGYVEEVSTNFVETDEPRSVPTYAEAGIAKPRAPVEPREVEIKDDAPTSLASPAPSLTWMERIEHLSEELQRHTKAMFAVAQELDALCTQHEASVGSTSLMTARSMLAGVKASVADALQLMGGRNG